MTEWETVRQSSTYALATMVDDAEQHLDGDLLLHAYINGIFPMADPDEGVIEWFRPDPRGILPLDTVHVPRSLQRRVRSGRFEVSVNRSFEEVLRACAVPRSAENGSWMVEDLLSAYLELYERGFAHSVEARRDGMLVGGLYGVQVGSAFFGESMFSRPESGGTDASKVCLVHLVERMRARGFMLLDTQFVNDHLQQFGCIEIPAAEYDIMLAEAIRQPRSFHDG
ncbi:MAG: leucyl/phenylalanyl-tRNA--protein transferase [Phycisphaerales bacterium]|nr:leucyl/phenylalanyl-tRNA--protein transferase [Phycisphaerales bacterium]